MDDRSGAFGIFAVNLEVTILRKADNGAGMCLFDPVIGGLRLKGERPQGRNIVVKFQRLLFLVKIMKAHLQQILILGVDYCVYHCAMLGNQGIDRAVAFLKWHHRDKTVLK